MIREPHISPLAAAHLKELRSRYLIQPTDQEILWIVELSKRVLAARHESDLDLIGDVVRVGDSSIYLYKLTIGCWCWLTKRAMPAVAGQEQIVGQCAMAFALAHARRKDVLLPLVAANDIIAAVVAFMEALPITVDELAASVDAALQIDREELAEALPDPGKPAAPGSAPRDILDPIAKLNAMASIIPQDIALMTGTDPDYWTWECSRDAAIRAYTQAKRYAAARSGAPLADVPTELIEALKDLKTAIKTIIERRSASVPSGDPAHPVNPCESSESPVKQQPKTDNPAPTSNPQPSTPS